MRSLCDKYNVVHIVDELKTGFRVARGGVQETLDKFATAVDITMYKSSQERRKVTTSYVQ